MNNNFIDIEKADEFIIPLITPHTNGCILDLRNLKVKCKVECENCLYSYETYLFVKKRIESDKIDITKVTTALEEFKKSGKETVTMEELMTELNL